MQQYIDSFVNECIDLGEITFTFNDWLSLEKTISQYHQVFKYQDEYGHERYYTLHTYNPGYKQACRSGQYESLGFWSDQDGNPLCEKNDPFNYGDVNNRGSDIDRLHYKSYFELRHKCHYYWDDENEDENFNYNAANPKPCANT